MKLIEKIQINQKEFEQVWCWMKKHRSDRYCKTRRWAAVVPVPLRSVQVSFKLFSVSTFGGQRTQVIQTPAHCRTERLTSNGANEQKGGKAEAMIAEKWADAVRAEKKPWMMWQQALPKEKSKQKHKQKKKSVVRNLSNCEH